MDYENDYGHDHEKAGDDTLAEVNILILDYMMCMSIHEATSGQVQDWGIWQEDTQRSTLQRRFTIPRANGDLDG
jgi:hypothetical protein